MNFENLKKHLPSSFSFVATKFYLIASVLSKYFFQHCRLAFSLRKTVSMWFHMLNLRNVLEQKFYRTPENESF